jgi:hypothetical protein
MDGGRVRLGGPHGRAKLRLGDAMLDRAHTLHAADRRAVTSGGIGRLDQAGVYLTDEVFLYRVVDRVLTPMGEMIEVEDCYWLDVVRVPVGDLVARRLRVVTPF